MLSALTPLVIRLKFRLWLAGSLTLSGSALAGETSPQAAIMPVAIRESSDVSAAKPYSPDLLSLRLKAALNRALPTYESGKPGPGKNVEWTTLIPDNAGAGEVFVLPRFMIRGPRLPKAEDLLSLTGKMDRYLGPKDGFDRRLLNRVVLHWDFGWYSVVLFDAVKNETRAKDMYFEDQRLRNREDLLDFAARLKLTGDLAGVELVERESDRLFFRKTTLKRK